MSGMYLANREFSAANPGKFFEIGTPTVDFSPVRFSCVIMSAECCREAG